MDLERHIASLMSPTALLEFVTKLAKERDEFRDQAHELHNKNDELRNEVRELKLGKFTCFSKLPPELRIKIWKYALPGPRVVYIVRPGTSSTSPPQGLRSSCPIPALLHVNREARQVALRFYSLSFGLISQNELYSRDPHIYCNFNQDIILFSADIVFCLMVLKEKQAPYCCLLQDIDLVRIQKLGLIYHSEDAWKISGLDDFFAKFIPKEVFFAFVYEDASINCPCGTLTDELCLCGTDVEMRINDSHTDELNKLPFPKSLEEWHSIESILLSEELKDTLVMGLELKLILAQESVRRGKEKVKKYISSAYCDLFKSGKDVSKIDIAKVSLVKFHKAKRPRRYC